MTPETLSKGEFAAMMNLSPGRISQLIGDGKISAAALSGQGRAARIVVAQAKADLARTLDASQSFGLNGLKTRAAMAKPDVLGPDSPHVLVPVDTAEKIARQKLIQAEFQTRQMEREEALETGRYMLAEQASVKLAQFVGTVLATFETGLSTMADDVMSALADARANSQSDLTARDVHHVLQKSFRVIREKAAVNFAERGEKIRAAKVDALKNMAASAEDVSEETADALESIDA